jgi:hypothetical protein
VIRPRTGLMEMVVQAVTRLGEATVDDMEAEFPQFTRKRIHDALANARYARRLRIKTIGTGHGQRSSVWEAGTHAEPTSRSRSKVKPMPIASVWELGTPREITMPKERGRVYNLLGGWNDLV